YDAIFRRVEHVVQGERELHRAQVGGEVATGLAHRLDEELAQLPGELGQAAPVQLAQVGGQLNLIEQRISHDERTIMSSARLRKRAARWANGASAACA